ncbi:heavy metal translocating P-type ATPase [Gemmatimonas aurantiaca]|uniref:heavy metal translocating P-type ATPase n=1 Tax=Gemmatimonas aurantiaca TaxID=173480 RepID=UPI00301C94F3
MTLAFLVAGALTPLVTPAGSWRQQVWLTGLLVTGAPVAWRTLRGMLRGNFAADVVAMLAIVGAVLLQEPLAGLVVVLMQTGGEALDAYAVARASDAVEALEADAPRMAHRVEGERITDIAAEDIAPDDMLLIRPGELVPADGVVIDGHSHVDTSRLTGEPMPRRVSMGATLQSGSINQEGALRLRAVRRAQESQYARIVDLVRRAQASKSPLQRTADRWAIWFTPLTLVLCGLAWLMAHDWTRVLAVLVVATPCPLILAAPVAIIGGINRAARRGIIVRTGQALEGLARVNTVVFDKTGTLTTGMPHVATMAVAPLTDATQALARIAAIEQGSGHLLARVLVNEAEARGVPVLAATALTETPGRGVEGDVAGVTVAVGSASYVRDRFAHRPDVQSAMQTLDDGSESLRAWALMSDGVAARFDFAETLRPDLSSMFRKLADLGLGAPHLLSGDNTANVQRIAHATGITSCAGDLSAEDKAHRVAALEASGQRVLMVGDGTNDAPALSAATVGVALAGHGGGVVAEAADVVLLVDDPQCIPEAVHIGRRSLAIARQSIAVGLGLSLIGMGFAAAGQLSPVAGAVTQEIIDVAVILNALRAAGPGRGDRGRRRVFGGAPAGRDTSRMNSRIPAG